MYAVGLHVHGMGRTNRLIDRSSSEKEREREPTPFSLHGRLASYLRGVGVWALCALIRLAGRVRAHLTSNAGV